MPISLATARMISNRLPFDSFSNIVLQWFNTKGWLDTKDLSFSTLSSLNEKSIDTTVLMVARLGFIFFIFPHATTPVAIYNLSVGVCYISIGFVLAFKGVRTEEDQKTIAKVFHIGFMHTLTAVYDFAIGRLIQVPFLGWSAVVLFALFPQSVLNVHTSVFKTPSTPLDTSGPKDKDEKVVEPNLPRAYLEKGCKLDELARRYALRLASYFPLQNSDTLTPQKPDLTESSRPLPSKNSLLD